MSDFKILASEGTTNLFLDPQFGAADPDTAYDISATGGSSPDVTRITSDSYIGSGCAQFDFDGASAMIMKQDITTTATSYTVSMRVKRSGGGAVTNSHCQCRFDSSNDNWDSISADRDNWYLCVRTATATAGSREFGIRALEDSLIVDAWQVEQKAYRTTYCDGSLRGNMSTSRGDISDGYYWHGAEHASKSTRHAQERSGGRVRDIEDDLSVQSVMSMDGAGEAPVHINTTELSLLPGELYQNTTTDVRFIDFGLAFSGTSISNLHTNRETLIDVIRKERTNPTQPFVFRYTGGSTTKEIDLHYLSGLGLNNPNKFVETTIIRTIALNPFFRELGEYSAALDPYTAQSNVDYWIDQDTDGTWATYLDNTLGEGLNSPVAVLFQASDGKLYFGGSFTDIASAPAGTDYQYVCYVDVSIDQNSYQSLESGVNNGTDSVVRGITEGPDGTIYIVGDFQNAGGSSANRIATWDGTNLGTLGTGFNADARAVLVGHDGTVYGAGDFTTAGGGGANRIASWGGSSWAALGTGLNNDAYTLALSKDGKTLYVGGDFTTAGGATANRIAAWDIDNSSWSTLGTGFNDTVRSLLVTEDGTLFAGGEFTTADGATANYIAKWDGQQWLALGTGFDALVANLYLDRNNDFFIVGSFTTASGVTVDGFVAWRNGVFVPFDVNPGGSTEVSAVTRTKDGRLWIGGSFFDSGATTTSGEVTTVTNGGSANTYPSIIVDGPGQLISLTNYTTGAAIYFDINLNSSETVTLDLQPEHAKFISNFRGDINRFILNGSDMSGFFLQPGDNSIGIFCDNSTAAASMVWTELHTTVDS